MQSGYRIKVGRTCNNSCIVCGALEKKASHDRTLDEISSLIEQSDDIIIFPCNTDSHPDFLDMLKKAKDMGKQVILETNGREFSKSASRIRGVADSVTLMDFGGEEVHEKVTLAPGSYVESRQGKQVLIQSGIPITQRDLDPLHCEAGIVDRPQEVVIELTSACNFHCTQCFNKTTMHSEKQMPTSFVKQVINGIAEAGIGRVRFSGGEPVLRKDLFELMGYAKQKGLSVWLNTNGSLITPEIARKIGETAENVLVAFNGWDQESEYQWSRTPGGFRNKVAGVGELMGVGIPVVRTGTVATPDNIAHLEEIHSLVRGLDIKNWELWRPIPLSKGERGMTIDPLLRKILRFRMEDGMRVMIANALPFCCGDPRLLELVCTGAGTDDGHSRLIVDPSGYAKPSYFIAENLGDPRKPLDAWNHRFMKKMRELTFVPERCKDCQYVMRCKGGSRYIGNLEGGAIDADDPLMDRRNVQ